MSGPRVYDGRQWTAVAAVAEDENESGPRPVRPVDDGDGTIFVSIASYRGTENSATGKCLFVGHFFRFCRSHKNGL
jgi:hypothetical protein